ncbi:MAG: hypothetical protein JWM25_373 [Thermoleophilia bacterium]|nr:hypothetical protein [Thermoleophilia bacterium]
MAIAPTTSVRTVLSPQLRERPIGNGTVQSEVDRTLRVRFEGTGPPSQRTLVADSAAAATLMDSPAGATFERGVRALLGSADVATGAENLRSLTLLPDEHASKAVVVLNDVLARSARGEAPGITSERIRELTQYEDDAVATSGARNLGGHMVLMPGVSRDMLGSLGLYRAQYDDESQATGDAAAAGRWSWHAALHEVQHSITPRTKGDEVESSRVLEESIAEVLSPALVTPALRRAGADPARLLQPREEGEPAGAVDWQPWNRDHLFDAMPPAPAGSETLSTQRYVDGPQLLRGLTQLAGIDRRTTEGRRDAAELLQGVAANYVPERIARRLVREHGASTDQVGELTRLIRAATVGTASLADIRAALSPRLRA